jgi:rhamnogalacturonan endolyase
VSGFHGQALQMMRIANICAAAAVLLILGMSILPAVHAAEKEGRVTLLEDKTSFTLSNGIVTARILKNNGDIRSLLYKGTELLTDKSGHPGGYWSHDTTGGADLVTKVTIDPADSGGERAEVSIKGISGGIKMGHGPGAAPDGDFPADIEIRYTLGRGDAGIYTYCIFEHLPEYDAATMTEARFAVKLADFFDWLSADEDRNKYYPETLPDEDKYVYTAIQWENRAFGFSSTTRDIGFYFINPTVEYLSGGPTKPEFLVHRDTTEVQAPVVLNYWRSSHYGGANVTVADGEAWAKVIGPFMLYVNEGPDPMTMWRDARAKAEEEAQKWSYAWVDANTYATPEQRSTVTGRLLLNDPELRRFPGRILVGLAQPAYRTRMPGGRETEITWQTDAKHYQFWVQSDNPDGRFTIPKVSPGEYTLYALADGVLGEFARAGVAVGAGKVVDLGELEWMPVRYGKQVLEIGIPNRTATEFAGGNRYFEPDITLQYARLFPDDVTFTVGESRYDEDWFFAHVPHNTDPQARVQPFRGVSGNGRATPYTIRFNLDDAPQGSAVLRLAICGTGTRSIDVSVNGEQAGTLDLSFGDGVISRHQIRGLWYERALKFDASMLQAGNNKMTLTVPAGNITAGVIYDYLRLEIDDSQ